MHCQVYRQYGNPTIGGRAVSSCLAPEIPIVEAKYLGPPIVLRSAFRVPHQFANQSTAMSGTPAGGVKLNC